VTQREDFFWAGGASSLAIEGAGRRSDYARWESASNIEASADGNGFRERFADDFALFSAHGLRAIRLTVEWARLEPFPGRIDHEELEHLQQVFTAANEAGLDVWTTLHHGSLPGWFSEDTTGFRTNDGPSIHWSRHVDRVAELFDHFTAVWAPIEDPIGWAIRGHHLGTRPPRRRSTAESREEVQNGLVGILDATFDAHRLLASGDTPVVGTFTVPTLHAVEPAAQAERAWWDHVYWKSWTQAITDGVLEWPWSSPTERPDAADAFTAIGIGIAAPIAVQPDGTFSAWPAAGRRDPSGFAPLPEQLADVIQRAAEALPEKDLVVTGLGVVSADDDWRAELFERWLDQIFSAVEDGVPIRGVVLDPVIDGYSEVAGAHIDAGVFTRDREPKPSFRWIEAQQ
jgi:beta-glucosidase